MLRGARRARAWMALASFLAGYGVAILTGVHVIADDDTACDPVPLAGYPSTVVLHHPTTAPAPQHCTICHLLRQVSGAHTSSFATVVGAGTSARAVVPAEVRAKAATCLEHRSSRAPPALSLA